MNIYEKRRIEKGLSKYTVAKEMGLTLDQYRNIERGLVNLESEYLDKFNDIMNRAKEIRINRMDKIQNIKIMIKSGELKYKLKQQGYSMAGLAKKLDMGATTVNYVFMLKKVSDDAIEQVYDYLMNPANKNLKIENRGRKTDNRKPIEKEKPLYEIKIEDLEKEIDSLVPKEKSLYEIKIEDLEKEIDTLKIQISRYEKLIDRM